LEDLNDLLLGRARLEGLPQGASITRGSYDYDTGWFQFGVEHPSFRPVSEGEYSPRIPVEITREKGAGGEETAGVVPAEGERKEP
jgi:hypothetical protein